MGQQIKLALFVFIFVDFCHELFCLATDNKQPTTVYSYVIMLFTVYFLVKPLKT